MPTQACASGNVHSRSLPCSLKPCAAGMATDAFEEFVVGHGELWCAQLTAAKCRQLGADCTFMDTRDVLVVTPTSDGNSVDVQYEASLNWL